MDKRRQCSPTPLVFLSVTDLHHTPSDPAATDVDTLTSQTWAMIRASLSDPAGLDAFVNQDLTLTGPMVDELRQAIAATTPPSPPSPSLKDRVKAKLGRPDRLWVDDHFDTTIAYQPFIHSAPPPTVGPPAATATTVVARTASGVLWSTTPPRFDLNLFGPPRFRGVRLPAELSTDIVIWAAYGHRDRLTTRDAVDAIWAGHASTAAVRAGLDRVNTHQLIEPLLDPGQPLIVRERSVVGLNPHYSSDWAIFQSLLSTDALDRLAVDNQIELLTERFDSVMQLALAGPPLDHTLRNDTAGGWDQLARNHINRTVTVAAAHWIALLTAQDHTDRARQLVNDLTTANPNLHLPHP